ncbi:LytR/AlgR family response regulator transcription factor [Aureispira anguillae]|uniref:LytTR family DNA-binding domain-containing protein n=1 Tax=Aureispira anguillae TaxID=2864201 RepID=A0A915YDL0_9BACT|nr:LytTR family DNA-binding domain-containing protein [Aureispira anguillae]BDS11128.1 LytTR family DNA-binding domain-containing protein [Aureispira anguillae]
MNTVIIDDEFPAIEILSSFAKKIPFIDLKLATTNAFEALDLLNSTKIDLLLLDVEMPDITGLELLNALENPPLVILTTAYDNYALKGYELDLVDYILKPIRFDRFLKGVNKAHKLFKLQHNNYNKDYLLLKVDYKTVKVLFQDILYIEGLKDYVKVFTTKAMYLTRLNLKNITNKLPSSLFVRVHRSYVVAIHQVTSFQKGQIFIDTISIPLGASFQEQFLGYFK